MDVNDLTSFFRKIFKPARRAKISSNDLKLWTQNYEHKYDGLKHKELIVKFIEDMRAFIEVDLESKKSWNNPDSPQKFLIDLAKTGTMQYGIFYGYIPKDKIEMLKPYIEKLIVKIFELRNFKGFNLIIKNETSLNMKSGSIKLNWNESFNQPESTNKSTKKSTNSSDKKESSKKSINNSSDKKESSKKSRERSRQRSRIDSIKPVVDSTMIPLELANRLAMPIYDPNMISQQQLLKEIKRDVRKNIKKLRQDIKKTNTTETSIKPNDKDVVNSVIEEGTLLN
tara:strand:+ start:2639 stop:3487 length:849 start_codon:yes stop_codon:yes gene_type:complete